MFRGLMAIALGVCYSMAGAEPQKIPCKTSGKSIKCGDTVIGRTDEKKTLAFKVKDGKEFMLQGDDCNCESAASYEAKSYYPDFDLAEAEGKYYGTISAILVSLQSGTRSDLNPGGIRSWSPDNRFLLSTNPYSEMEGAPEKGKAIVLWSCAKSTGCVQKWSDAKIDLEFKDAKLKWLAKDRFEVQGTSFLKDDGTGDWKHAEIFTCTITEAVKCVAKKRPEETL
jgi:hypothetical protein